MPYDGFPSSAGRPTGQSVLRGWLRSAGSLLRLRRPPGNGKLREEIFWAYSKAFLTCRLRSGRQRDLPAHDGGVATRLDALTGKRIGRNAWVVTVPRPSKSVADFIS